MKKDNEGLRSKEMKQLAHSHTAKFVARLPLENPVLLLHHSFFLFQTIFNVMALRTILILCAIQMFNICFNFKCNFVF